MNLTLRYTRAFGIQGDFFSGTGIPNFIWSKHNASGAREAAAMIRKLNEQTGNTCDGCRLGPGRDRVVHSADSG